MINEKDYIGSIAILLMFVIGSMFVSILAVHQAVYANLWHLNSLKTGKHNVHFTVVIHSWSLAVVVANLQQMVAKIKKFKFLVDN